MQQIEFVGENIKKSDELVDLSLVDEAELITDPVEVEGIIRRAVTILWNGSVFSFDELAAHLTRNYVVLPDSINERNELFEASIERVWHTQKELARVACTSLPTRIRHFNAEEQQEYHGIVVPLSLNFAEEPIVSNEPALADVIEINEKQTGLSAQEVAKRIFELLTATSGQETVIGIQKLKSVVKAERPTTDEVSVDTAIKTLVDNGYVTLRRTGNKKNTRWNVVMDQAVKQEVLADIEEGVLEEGLGFMFNEQSLTLSS